MTKTQVEVITSTERRRRWSRAEKERIVAAAMEPGAVASEVARSAGIHASQLFRWRQQLCAVAPGAPVFSPVELAMADAGLSFIKPCLSKLASSPTKLAEYLAAGLELDGHRDGDTESDQRGHQRDPLD